MHALPFRAAVTDHRGGVLLELLVTAGAASASFPHRYDAWRKRIGIRVRAPPTGGRANREVAAAVAAFFGRPEREVTITRGATDSAKTVAVHGVDLAEALERLAEATTW